MSVPNYLSKVQLPDSTIAVIRDGNTINQSTLSASIYKAMIRE